MLNNIYTKLADNQLNDAFELLISNEDNYKDNSIYWCLRGDLCCLINEFETAINCYNKSISLDITHTMPTHRLIDIYTGLNDINSVNYYKENLNIINQSIETKVLQFIAEDLKLSKIADNYSLIKDKLDSYISNMYYLKDDYLISNKDKIYLPYFFDKDNNFSKKANILVSLNKDYIENTKKLTEYGVTNISVIMIYQNKIHIVQVDNNTLKEFKKNNRDNTVAFFYLNESDSNVFSLYKNIPDNLKDKFNRLLFTSKDFSLENMARIPLLAGTSVSGHEIFISYPCPELMYNIEVGHGIMPLKACGALDKVKNFAFSNRTYRNANKVTVTSTMDMVLFSSFTSLDKDKFLISGAPRTDLLMVPNSRKNLEKLLKTKLNDKKVLFNMPTFHNHDASGVVNGSKNLNSFVKIPDFNYKKFDEFLKNNNMICILKVHHAEAKSILKRNKDLNVKNIYTISNEDLKKCNLDLYEVLGGGDLLITDYSSVYSDFLFMEKPIVFTNYDIEEYRENRGLALEPYDFWTAGPKVTTQDDLEKEIIKSLSNEDYYKDKRKELKSVFFKYNDNKSSHRIWEHINSLDK